MESAVAESEISRTVGSYTRRVLIAHSHGYSRVRLKEVFSLRGYDVVIASDSESAVGLIEGSGFDLCIADCSLPTRGVSLLRSRHKGSSVPGLDVVRKFSSIAPASYQFAWVLLATDSRDAKILENGSGVARDAIVVIYEKRELELANQWERCVDAILESVGSRVNFYWDKPVVLEGSAQQLDWAEEKIRELASEAAPLKSNQAGRDMLGEALRLAMIRGAQESEVLQGVVRVFGNQGFSSLSFGLTLMRRHAGASAELFVKICRPEEGRREEKNYREFYELENFGHRVALRGSGSSIRGRLFVCVFNLYGSLRQASGALKEERGSDKSVQLLESLLRDLDGVWYSKGRSDLIPFSRLFSSVEGFTAASLGIEGKCSRLLNTFVGVGVKLRQWSSADAKWSTDLSWVAAIAKYCRTSKKKCLRWVCVSHGDLHLRNVLVSESGSLVSIVDFSSIKGRTSGSLMGDMAMLEVSILLETLDGSSSTLDKAVLEALYKDGVFPFIVDQVADGLFPVKYVKSVREGLFQLRARVLAQPGWGGRRNIDDLIAFSYAGVLLERLLHMWRYLDESHFTDASRWRVLHASNLVAEFLLNRLRPAKVLSHKTLRSGGERWQSI